MTTQLGRYTLRPPSEDDLEMVLGWRNQERIRAVMYTDHVISWDEHVDWYTKMKEDPSQEYRVFEIHGRPVGLVGIQGVDDRDGVASWVFYLGEADVPPGTGSRMEYLALLLAFETLGVRKLMCEAFAFNVASIKLNKKFGFEEEGVLRRHRLKDGAYRDVVVLALFADTWHRTRDEKRRLLFPEDEG